MKFHIYVFKFQVFCPYFIPQPHSFKCNMRFYHGVSAITLRASKNDNMGNSLSLIVVTKFLIVLTIIINQLPHCSAQDYLGKLLKMDI